GTLTVSLYPSGSTTFVDGDDPMTGRTYSLYDYLDGINAVLLYTTQADKVTFTLLQRANNRRIALPEAPVLSPDRKHLVTADFCEQRCENEVAVWRIDAQGVQKELSWAPKERWLTAVPSWKDATTLKLEYSLLGDEKARTVERGLNDPAWQSPRLR